MKMFPGWPLPLRLYIDDVVIVMELHEDVMRECFGRRLPLGKGLEPAGTGELDLKKVCQLILLYKQ